MSIIKFIVLGIVLIVIVGALLGFLVIPSYFQYSSNSSYDAPYTSLTLRSGINETATLEFGDTDYDFVYPYGSYLGVHTFFDVVGETYTPHNGDVYKYDGIEIDVSTVASDYISHYITILVKPTVQNYMASIHYTKVNIPLYQTQAVNISSGLINETHLYRFTYVRSEYPVGILQIQASSGPNQYRAMVPDMITYLDIEVTVYKVETGYMVIYVKPLY